MSKASEVLVEVTILTVLFCCNSVRYYITKSVLSGSLSTWVGLLSNGVGLFLGERASPENRPTPFESEGFQNFAHPPL